MITKPHVLILGAGPAGLGAANQIVQKKLANVSVIEKHETVGGAAASFPISDVWVDYGSHRLHPSCDPNILHDIKMLLGDDLLDRPRHGRIRLRNRWISFPLKPVDLALKLPISFSVSTVLDLLNKILRKNPDKHYSETFGSVLEAGLGKTICQEFYFPYARKIWGLSPSEMSPKQAHRRVSANSLKKMLTKVFSVVPGFKQPGSGRFYYPRYGIGQISACLYDAAINAGATFYLNSQVDSIKVSENRIDAVSISGPNSQNLSFQPDYVWSTIPLPTLVRLLNPPAPAQVTNASNNIQYRAMILIYLVLEQGQFSEYDAHYFPEQHIPITRLSEPKNYSNIQVPRNRTVLCAELPCSINDSEWKMTDMELGEIVCDCLKSVSFLLKTSAKNVVTRRINHAYPIYIKDYELHFNQIDRWLNEIGNIISFGRQGLFAHDNIHHALSMGYAAVDCLGKDGIFDNDKWQNYYREVFETHIVED